MDNVLRVKSTYIVNYKLKQMSWFIFFTAYE